MPKHPQKAKPTAGRASERSIKDAAPRASAKTTANAKGLDATEKSKGLPQPVKSQLRPDKKQIANEAKKTASPHKAVSQKAAITRKPASSDRRNTKQDTVIALLQQPKGTTIAAMMAATGWQQHSVRGFLAGVVRKRLGLDLVSEKTEQGRIYRIAGKLAASGKNRRKAA